MVSPLTNERARIGLILPSSNRLSEPQFNRYAPAGVVVCCTRLRNRPRDGEKPMDDPGRIAEAALELADAGAEIIVYHCTGASMSGGPEGEQSLVELIERTTGIPSTTTAGAVVAALRQLGAHRLVFLAPSIPASGDKEAAFLRSSGFEVLRETSMGLIGAEQYVVPTPNEWLALARSVEQPDADAYFFACTTTQAPEALEDVEAVTGKPAVASNQATLWHCLRMLDLPDVVEGLGQLMQLQCEPLLAR